MKKIFTGKIVSSIDIGTTKICVLIGHELDEGKIEILGFGKVPSHGLSKGVVVDIAQAVRSIRAAVQEAELMAGIEIESAIIGISGAHIQSRNSYGAVPIEKGAVSQNDITAVIAAAKAIPLPEGQQVLHVLPQFFSIDGSDRIQDPLGMHGIRLEAQVHMVTGSTTSVQNLVVCCERAGVQVQDVVLEQLASAYSVLNEDERKLGVGVIDIGGGTSDLAIYQHGAIRHTMVLPVAGNHFTNDLAIGLRITMSDAERVKREYGLASVDLLLEDKEVEVEMVQGGKRNMTTTHAITEILEPRAQELLSIIHEEILGRNMESLLVSGLVITGGGSLLEGIKDLAESIFDIPVRIGKPNIIHEDPAILGNPMYATSYGLLLYAIKKDHGMGVYTNEEQRLSRVLTRMKSWVSDFF